MKITTRKLAVSAILLAADVLLTRVFAFNTPLIDSICRVCQDVIDTWQSGGTRDIPRECVFLRMTEDGVELRTEFTGGNTWNVVNN